jgi:Bacterial Ig-like domain
MRYETTLMTRPLAASVLIALCCLTASAASAQGAKEVEGVVVEAGPGPTVKSTYPAAGVSVPAGAVILKLVFDQPMTADAWAYGRSTEGDFPSCLAEPRLLSDQRTFVLLCSADLPNRTYAVEINFAPRFTSANGRSAKPYTLKFSTNEETTVGLHDALLQAGLTDADDPIMNWRDAGQGVSQTPPPQ